MAGGRSAVIINDDIVIHAPYYGAHKPCNFLTFINRVIIGGAFGRCNYARRVSERVRASS